ncbi:MAG: hypothetical protein LBG11_07060 [Bifidobacteriaceae bacterium]|jgi:hypothetical protein|nr:hypothetical protein [Bifidobacteriaceae bacterium]
MANVSTAKVMITAEKVGPELEAYIEASADSDYNILDTDPDGYTVEKQGDTWTFTGLASGQWNYGNNLEGYFSQTDEQSAPVFAAGWIEDEARALADALKERDGVIRFVVADSEEGMGWVETSTAVCQVEHNGRLSCEKVSAGRQDYTTANVMAAYGCTLREAAHLMLEEDADEFFEEWEDEYRGRDPSPEDFDEWAGVC